MSRAPGPTEPAGRRLAASAGHGVGEVRTAHRRVASPADPLVLRCGRILEQVDVAFQAYGRLAPAGDNAVVVCHALTADAHAAGVDAATGATGWWDGLIGPGRPIDTERHFVVCATLLGSCLGSTGPTSPDPATGRPYGLGFPPIAIADQVAVLRRLTRALGVTRLHALVGPSLGGMHALEWFLTAPEEVDRTVLIATSARLTVENRAFAAAGRQAILDDPGFEGGRYLELGGPGPVRGLAAARRFAHLTYRSAGALEARLGDAAPADWPPAQAADWLAPSRAVETYLAHQGSSFVDRFDALSYLYLTRPMDDFDPFGGDPGEAAAGRWAAARAAIGRNPQARHTLVSFDTDWRFGRDHGEHLAGRLGAAGARHVEHRELASPWGHDAFLLDPPGLPELIEQALVSPVG